MIVSSGLIPATELRTEDDVRRFDRRRRADRSLRQPLPQPADARQWIPERAPDGPQASTSRDLSAEPSHQQVRIARLVAAGIVFAAYDARRVD